MITVFGFYKFKKIRSLKEYKSLFQREISKHNIRGTIILSPEGLNGTIAGYKKNIVKITKMLKREFKFTDFDSKILRQVILNLFIKAKLK